MLNQIHVTSKFVRAYKKLPAQIKIIAQQKEKCFHEDPFHLSLKTHKLHGKEKEAWSFAINFSYRIKFIFLREGEVLFLDIGDHSIYE